MILLSLLFSLVTHAQVFEGPPAAALAGSGRAGLDSTDGVFLNPALVALLPKPEMAAYFKDGDADIGQHRNAWGLAISENSSENVVSGSLAYFKTRNTGLLSTPVNGEIWHASVGKLFFDQLAIGASVFRYGANPEVGVSTEQWNGSVGGVFLVLPRLGVAYVYDNPAHPSSDVANAIKFVPQQSFGIFWSTPYFARVRLDVIHPEELNPNQRWNIHGSLESEFGEFFLFRMGGRWDEVQEERFITAGLSFNGPRLKIDFAIEKNIYRVGGAVHSVDLRGTF